MNTEEEHETAILALRFTLERLPPNGTRKRLEARREIEEALKKLENNALVAGPTITTATGYQYRIAVENDVLIGQYLQQGADNWRTLAGAPRVMRALLVALRQGPDKIPQLFWTGAISNT